MTTATEARPRVYLDTETGLYLARFCGGRRKDCRSINCTCSADGPLVPASGDEAEAFWDDYGLLADYRIGEGRHGR